MSKTGIRLDSERRVLFLDLGGDKRYPDHWLVMLRERGDSDGAIGYLIPKDHGSKRIVEEIQSNLFNRCSSHWVEHEFPGETAKVIAGLIEEVQSFDRLISELELPDDKMRDAFLDVSGGLRIEIKAAMFRLLQRRRPAAAQLVLEGFHRIGEDTPAWAEPIPTVPANED